MIDALLHDQPTSVPGLGLRLRALAGMGRRDEVRSMAARGRDDAAMTPEARRQLARAATSVGAFAEAIALLEQICELPQATAWDLNNLAWARLHLEPVPASARAAAQQAVDRAGRGGTPELHTLAAVLAETGEPEQAMTTLRKVVAGNGQVRSEDWLVVARIAEAYGLPDAARAAYRKVDPPGEPSTPSTYALAQRWLARLDAARK